MDFTFVKLSDICDRLSSGKNIKSKDIYTNGEFPVYGGNGIRGYTNNYNFDGECVIIADRVLIAAIYISSLAKHI